MPSRPGCALPVRPTAGSIINTGDAGGAELAARLADWGDRVITVARGR